MFDVNAVLSSSRCPASAPGEAKMVFLVLWEGS